MLSRGDVLIRLREVTSELSGLHRELATVLIAEAKAKAEAWRDTDASSVAAADREARYRAVDYTLEAIRLKGEIAAFEAEQTFLVQFLPFAD